MDSQVSATPRISAPSLTLASAAQLLSNLKFGARTSVWEAVSDGQSLCIESSVAARRAPPTFKRGGYLTLLVKLTTQNPASVSEHNVCARRHSCSVSGPA